MPWHNAHASFIRLRILSLGSLKTALSGPLHHDDLEFLPATDPAAVATDTVGVVSAVLVTPASTKSDMVAASPHDTELLP